MNYFLLALSVCANVAYSSFYNYFGKKAVKERSDNYKINMCIYSVAAGILVAISIFSGFKASLFTVLFGIAFGAVTALSGIFKLNALNCGPMSFTILLITSSMILPAFSGYIIWNESLSVWKIVGTFLMIVAAYFSTEKKKDGKGTSAKWLIFCFLAFLFMGSIGIMQKTQQKSSFASETGAFLAIAFVSAAILCTVSYLISSRNKTEKSSESGIDTKKLILLTVVCGAFIAFLNKVNLYLSGVLDSAVLFPIQNGGTTMMSVVVAMTLFREKVSGRRLVGMIIALCALLILAFSELLAKIA